ncbi:unnamed protein product [Staurois parvus]|uniref:Uncharacterized protein n=1 Tax=Staurois parvus TaxID=386267 RepID=A0ABN9FFC9_9NEOB|nr:unnamed protein product [Staurois parvus]
MSFRPVEQSEGLRANPSPILFSASPPKRLPPLSRNPHPPEPEPRLPPHSIHKYGVNVRPRNALQEAQTRLWRQVQPTQPGPGEDATENAAKEELWIKD